MKPNVAIYILFIAILNMTDIFSQCEAGNYQIKEYVHGDTCWIMYADLLAMDNCKPFGIVFDFWCSQTFKNKYKPGTIFNYVFCYYNEDYIRLIPIGKKPKLKK